MPTITAREELGNLIIDFGDGTDYTVYPVPGKIGIEIQAMLVGVALGATLAADGPDKVIEDTDRMTRLALGVKDPDAAPRRKLRKAPNQTEQAAQRRWNDFQNLRSARQAIVAQAALLWNCGGGGIDAVLDLLDEAGGYPKALERVMQSSGLGAQYKTLKAWLDGAAQAQNSEAASTEPTTTPTGGKNTSA